MQSEREPAMTLSEEMVGVRALRGLGEEHLQKLAAMAQPQECPAGGVLFSEGDASGFIFILLSGEVVLEIKAGDRDPAAVYVAGPGQLLGWSPVLGRHAMTATARAATSCRLAALDVARVEDLIQQDPRFGVAFLRHIALIVSDRLSATRRCLAATSSHGRLPPLIPREGSD
jgi:CRP-like cAMP-binding protein